MSDVPKKIPTNTSVFVGIYSLTFLVIVVIIPQRIVGLATIDARQSSNIMLIHKAAFNFPIALQLAALPSWFK